MATTFDLWFVGAEGADAARELFLEYQEGLGVDLCFQSFEEELAGLPGKYAEPRGALLLVYSDAGELVGCGALRPLDEPSVCELKRIYVRSAFRGHGLGRLISEALMDRAKEIGYRTVRLDTLARLTSAIKIYRDLGFTEIPAYNYNPEDDIVYFERSLT